MAVKLTPEQKAQLKEAKFAYTQSKKACRGFAADVKRVDRAHTRAARMVVKTAAALDALKSKLGIDQPA